MIESPEICDPRYQTTGAPRSVMLSAVVKNTAVCATAESDVRTICTLSMATSRRIGIAVRLHHAAPHHERVNALSRCRVELHEQWSVGHPAEGRRDEVLEPSPRHRHIVGAAVDRNGPGGHGVTVGRGSRSPSRPQGRSPYRAPPHRCGTRRSWDQPHTGRFGMSHGRSRRAG